jgi:DNA-binding Lrp family transcriptional regulator
LKLDAIDRRLLDMLQLHCDTPVAKLAAAVQLSNTHAGAASSA